MGIHKRKPDGRWIVSYRDDTGHVRTKGFPKGKLGKKAAEVFHAEIKFKKAKNEPLNDKPVRLEGEVYLDELTQAWIDNKKSQGRKRTWLADWVNVMNKYIIPDLESVPVSRITEGMILKIIDKRWADSSQSTRNRYIGYIKSIFNYGLDRGQLQSNPLQKWTKGKEPTHHSTLTYEQLRQIQAIAEPHLSWAIECAWHIPARPIDLFSLRFDTHYKPAQSGFRVYHTKVGKWSFNHCPQEFLERVETYRKTPVKIRVGDSVFHLPIYLVEYMGKPVKDLGKSLASKSIKLGFGHISFYDLRHCWITTAMDRGIELSTIAYLAGTSVKMLVKNYYQPHKAEQVRVMDLMPKMGKEEAESQEGENSNVFRLCIPQKQKG